MTDSTARDGWNERATAAEYAVLDRFVRRVPGIAWARSSWPPLAAATRGRPRRPGWHYWWSAHVIDATVDAARHRPTSGRLSRPRRFARGIPLRNGGTWSRPFWDDLAWAGLALARGGMLVGRRRRIVERMAAQLQRAIDPAVGAIPWRIGSSLYNAPANGPAAILLARTGRTEAATGLARWMDGTLRDTATGLILDGVRVYGIRHPDARLGRERVTDLYTYCQGVALGAYLAVADQDFTDRAAALVEAIAMWTGPGLVLPGSGGGDGGLFAGITCRYVAEAADRLAASAPMAAASARSIVLANADAAWHGAAIIDGRPFFAADWRRPADTSAGAPEHDLSVQLGAWLALEAAVDVTG